MQVKVYDGEYFERWPWWYIIFVTVVAFVIIVSIIVGNIVGVFLIFLLLWWYLLLWLILKKTTLKIADEGLKIWDKLYSWNDLQWFVLEIDEWNQELKNIVILRGNGKMIYTFTDDSETIKGFVQNLYDYIPMYSNYNQSFTDKLARTLKLW